MTATTIILVGPPETIELSPCPKCGGTTFERFAIHGGKSERLDCATCRRTRTFSRWHGVDGGTEDASTTIIHQSAADAAPSPAAPARK